MPRRLLPALCALLLTMTMTAPAGAAPASPRPVPTLETRFQDEATGDDALAEDEFSGFTMPGLTANNLTDMVLADIDAFWAEESARDGFDYYAAGIVPVSDAISSSCGQFGPYDNPAAYCPLDDTVYVSVPLGQDIPATLGDFAWITVLAHEWGHHVQVTRGITPEQSIDRELQADCFSGAYAQRARQQGFLQEGDITEAVLISMLSADPAEIGETDEGAHGSSDARVTAFMQGYLGGSSSCMSA